MIGSCKSKSGFTLIELLAVIVILAIVLVIAVPNVLNIIKNSTKSSMESDAKLILDVIDLKKLGDSDFDPLIYSGDTEGLLNALNLNGENYESVSIVEHEGKLLIAITGKGKWAGLTACGSYHDMKVSETGCDLDFIPPVITILGLNPLEISLGDTYVDPGTNVSDNSGEDIDVNVDTSSLNTNVLGEYTIVYTATDSSGNTATKTRTVNVVTLSYAGPGYRPSKGVNGPVLAQGMVPIKWNGSSWIDTTTSDSAWYNYTTTDKQWANARTADGSMWVWIPRYAYQISTCYHMNSADCNTATGQSAGTINIKFLKNNTNTASDSTQIYEDNATNTHFVKHPSFKFGTGANSELTGMWVAKFEMSGTIASLDSKPGVASLRSTTLSDMFIASRNMETNSKYGWGLASELNTTTGIFAIDTNNVDTHMMKNIEWGAVAYLSQSTYGKNSEIYTNSSSMFTTGCSAGSTSAFCYGGCQYTYDTAQGQGASTTGTIYGIYDMSGGADEYVMGNYNNTAGSSGLTPSSVNSKYINIYLTTGSGYDASNYGDAVYETSASTSGSTSWYSDYSILLSTIRPWFRRGGGCGVSSSAGVFGFGYNSGDVGSGYGFRSVLAVSSGL